MVIGLGKIILKEEVLGDTWVIFILNKGLRKRIEALLECTNLSYLR
jgi:hypothetical protein